MRLITLAIIAGIMLLAMAFDAKKCDHVFVSIEQAAIKIKQPDILGGQGYSEYSWPTGIREGKKLVCVKCFHKIKQLLDYGQPVQPAQYWPESSILNTFHCDTANPFKVLYVKGDTLYLK